MARSRGTPRAGQRGGAEGGEEPQLEHVLHAREVKGAEVLLYCCVNRCVNSIRTALLFGDTLLGIGVRTMKSDPLF